ncbi:DUF4303 domain-containing protein [Buchananella hordeovulneris]|uniref:DUF4303 domain-containing protein n=1 Tax=Buchananella hordeovulneris TaxID=52770 RepID=UPI00163B165A|nr:DUF4303 domain-containing protein [Buchananella hordeovulneris]
MTAVRRWQEVEDIATDFLVRAVREVRAAHPAEQPYGAFFFLFYADGSVLYFPCVAVGTEESLARAAAASGVDDPHAIRWSGADMEYQFLPGPREQACAAQVTAWANATASEEAWFAVDDAFRACFPRAARRARALLAGQVPSRFLTLAYDQDEELIAPSLSAAELATHFPDLG